MDWVEDLMKRSKRYDHNYNSTRKLNWKWKRHFNPNVCSKCSAWNFTSRLFLASSHHAVKIGEGPERRFRVAWLASMRPLLCFSASFDLPHSPSLPLNKKYSSKTICSPKTRIARLKQALCEKFHSPGKLRRSVLRVSKGLIIVGSWKKWRARLGGQDQSIIGKMIKKEEEIRPTAACHVAFSPREDIGDIDYNKNR